MAEPSPPPGAEDAAWAVIRTPLAPHGLRAFVADLPRLFRINPLLTFSACRIEDGRLRLAGRNDSNGRGFDLLAEVVVTAAGAEVRYPEGLKRATRFLVEAEGSGSRLTIVDDYGGTDAAERERRLDEVDRSLVPWAEALQEYLLRWWRWGWLAPWRWYMRRVWEPMSPQARRITRWIVIITILEFVFFLFVFAIFWIEWDGAAG